MKKSVLAVLFVGAMTILGSRAQARDHSSYYDGDRYSRTDYRWSEYGHGIRYSRPRYYYEDLPVVVRPRVVFDDDCRYRARYYYGARHFGGLHISFGGF
jgi:hypothetical protein